MPTLQFKGRNIIWNHHLSVPYHALEEVEDLHFQSQKGAENLIVEGDNLLALKALLPQYAGKVKCIYIDPPYNTGNEGWAYNDKVNSPLIRDWIGKEVDKEDLTKHDKWLCMMVPRLKLLRELLSDDGVIFISIDDNEVHNLRTIMDEIFGKEHFITVFIWNKKNVVQNDARFVSNNHEYVLCFSKDLNITHFNLLPRTKELNERYANPDKDIRGPWTSVALQAKSGSESNIYEITFPNGVTWKPVSGTYPRLNKESLMKAYQEERLWFGKNGKNVPRLKKYLSEVKRGVISNSILLSKDVGSTQKAKEEVKRLLKRNIFESPKPPDLISHFLKVGTNKNDIVLDSFSGSGTTMHAVMALNKEDGGNRKCIMVQMSEATPKEPDKNICRDITRERVKKAIEKYGYESGFQYFRVGPPIDPEAMLAGELPTYEQFAEYVFYLATGTRLEDRSKVNPAQHFVGVHGREAIYLIYEQNMEKLTRLALTLDLAKQIIAQSPKKHRTIYAPCCFLDEEYMTEEHIDFISVPYNLFERKASLKN